MAAATATTTRKPTVAQRRKAAQYLTNMAEIVKADRMVRGTYIKGLLDRVTGRQVPDPRRANAVCRGWRACAIGSLFLGAGVSPRQNEYHGEYDLPGQDDPTEYAQRNDKALLVALNALNGVALTWLEDEEIRRQVVRRAATLFEEPIELLFEGAFGTRGFGRREMLRVISTAKRRINAGKVGLDEVRWDDHGDD
jgi:hypothetical protein